MLWNNLKVRNKKNIRIETIVEGVSNGKNWQCGLEFDYANQESFYCRPLRTLEIDGHVEDRMPIPSEVGNISIAYLPSISGLTNNETRLDDGAINVRIGEGRTAEILRNLCYRVLQDSVKWDKLCERIHTLFRIHLDEPQYITERGEITMTYGQESPWSANTKVSTDFLDPLFTSCKRRIIIL